MPKVGFFGEKGKKEEENISRGRKDDRDSARLVITVGLPRERKTRETRRGLGERVGRGTDGESVGKRKELRRLAQLRRVAARKLARIEMDWRRRKKLVTLRCTSDLEAGGAASALPRNGGRPSQGFRPVWPIPFEEQPLRIELQASVR